MAIYSYFSVTAEDFMQQSSICYWVIQNIWASVLADENCVVYAAWQFLHVLFVSVLLSRVLECGWWWEWER